MKVKPTARVFISHSHADRHAAIELQRVMEEHNAQTFLDQDTIDALDNLPERVQQGISWCDSLLLLWSASAATSVWVRRELDTAYELHKRIIPYALDRTPLPPAYEDLVYIDAGDRQHGHAQLLRSVFGREFEPDDSATMFPGAWKASVDAFGVAQGTYQFELRENGQVEGEGGITNSGLAGQMDSQMGMNSLLSMRIPIHGSWSYDRGTKTLTIETSTGVVFGQQQNDTIMIRATGHEHGAITGKDLAGRSWTLERIGNRSRSRADKEKQEIREMIQKIMRDQKDSPMLWFLLASVCIGRQKESDHDLGLPIDEARRAVQAKGDAFQGAVKDFFQALEHGGWTKSE